ncbi:hypothetical protein WJT86_11630 [Microvirga sp. W0021]|uniref:Uncharacterized protein n=1 Tax=Hohaiivirga grylli TaxID=3133970 RepID=A0ABV0BLZ8_9HYPH
MSKVNDLLNAPGPINYDSIDYHLAWTAENPNYYKHEYVPSGETVERYKSMLLLELLTGNASVKDAAASQAWLISKRKKTDPVANMSLSAKNDSEELLLDFVMSARDAKGELIVEWNAYRYLPYTGPDGEKGVLLFAISRRAYGDTDTMAFMKQLKEIRSHNLKALVKTPVPVVSLNKAKK